MCSAFEGDDDDCRIGRWCGVSRHEDDPSSRQREEHEGVEDT